jgi:hypothetical protein
MLTLALPSTENDGGIGRPSVQTAMESLQRHHKALHFWKQGYSPATQA